jgi:hypothetical protein
VTVTTAAPAWKTSKATNAKDNEADKADWQYTTLANIRKHKKHRF